MLMLNNLNPEQWEKLFNIIGYRFNDKKLCLQALTHRSYGSENNERLEFLGDALINSIISNELYFKFKNSNEGVLTKLRVRMVRGETLAKIAQGFGLSEYLRLGKGELKSGGLSRQSILENTLEAIVGAIYLDSDYLETQKTVLNWFKDLINDLDEKCLKDPKTRLQEYCQANAMELPVYNLDKVTGNSPDQVFYVSIEHKSSSVKEKASGNSRKIAEQIAAEKLLKIMENK